MNSILIDGYNLVFDLGYLSHQIGDGDLHRARERLLNQLVQITDANRRKELTIVFDARDPPPGRPAEMEFQGMTVLFARDHESADDLIELLIKKHSSPRQLVVVSSDHRLHRAAARRRATAIDSDVWFDRLEREAQQPPEEQELPQNVKPQSCSKTQVRDWEKEFGDVSIEKIEQELDAEKRSRHRR